MSRVAAEALAEQLDRRDRVSALEDYLAALDRELGPVSESERRAARDWADRAFGPAGHAASPHSGGA